MASNTTIIFVPGAWHPASCWDKVAKHLEQAGFNTDLVDLPSVGPPEHLKGFEPDVEEVRRHVIAAGDAGQKVVLVCHSYGGLPTTQSVEGLDLKTRQTRGQPGGIVHLVYCCSFVIPEGESLIGAFGGNDLPWFIISDDKMQYFPNGPETVFYNDMSEEDAKSATAMLKPHSYQTAHSRLTYAGWKHVPSTYIYCLKDNAIPIVVQKMMVEQTAKGYGVRTETLDASHSPFWSMPKETAEAIQRAAES
ncbi:hypothetical protein M409DRAFT_59835 [Zasmidium cellare ATCC 36951]|uniref:AB hydrolase-1 domain-containing protein n=1 Tax=Zasmidium cellare ATCC 36951 TaxID=1080233 RepID=A0A6A6C2R2_ZASCE|nr:uncharacterized protein M409DRAFT_59835 [Zasmidium cellare ATCC 36951]KAF2160578.1 hypothetical protein M409DRAFT_59835 [Zasmidium cellare ATCC 36951]